MDPGEYVMMTTNGRDRGPIAHTIDQHSIEIDGMLSLSLEICIRFHSFPAQFVPLLSGGGEYFDTIVCLFGLHRGGKNTSDSKPQIYF